MAGARRSTPPRPSEAVEARFERDICLYRGDEARVFRAGDVVPPRSEGWVDHPSLTKAG